MKSVTERKPLVLFIHGFGSSSRCWSSLLRLLGEDERITSRYELATWDYPTKWIEVNLLGRIPRLRELGHALTSELDAPRYRGRELTLVGHSQGGLVIQSYLADTLTNGHASMLRDVRQAIFMATPSEGSTTGMSLRRLLSLFVTNPQEVTLRVLSTDVSDIRSVIRERIVGAVKDTDNTWRIPIHAFCGLQDDIVVEASARGVFDSVRSIPGTHFSILKPQSMGDPRYSEFVELLLEPGGHAHRFEIEQCISQIRIEPCDQKQIRTKSDLKPRVVDYDNYATLKRTVKFASSNRCRHNYHIQYATRGDGYVVGHPSHPNMASPADMGRAEDTGTFYRFEFLPEYGEDYCLKLDVYNGYGPASREVHFHLGDEAYYRCMSYILDLSAYLETGYAITVPPSLYLDPKDVGHSQLCAQREAREPLPWVSDRPGVFCWQFANVRQGVVDIVWDMVAPTEALGLTLV